MPIEIQRPSGVNVGKNNPGIPPTVYVRDMEGVTDGVRLDIKSAFEGDFPQVVRFDGSNWNLSSFDFDALWDGSGQIIGDSLGNFVLRGPTP